MRRIGANGGLQEGSGCSPSEFRKLRRVKVARPRAQVARVIHTRARTHTRVETPISRLAMLTCARARVPE